MKVLGLLALTLALASSLTALVSAAERTRLTIYTCLLYTSRAHET